MFVQITGDFIANSEKINNIQLLGNKIRIAFDNTTFYDVSFDNAAEAAETMDEMGKTLNGVRRTEQ